MGFVSSKVDEDRALAELLAEDKRGEETVFWKRRQEHTEWTKRGMRGPTVGLALGLRKGQAQRIITVKRGLHWLLSLFTLETFVNLFFNK